MRRTLLALASLALVGSLGILSPAEAVPAAVTLNITKVVEGDGPTGGFVIDWSCELQNGVSPGEVAVGDSLEFDAAGPGNPETQSVQINAGTTCTVTETNSNGADAVSYACVFTPLVLPPTPSSDEEIISGSCTSDQTATFNIGGEAATITVTNTFDTEVLPDEEEQEPEPDVLADVVAATPPFTG